VRRRTIRYRPFDLGAGAVQVDRDDFLIDDEAGV
jgi:hypothetical protein